MIPAKFSGWDFMLWLLRLRFSDSLKYFKPETSYRHEWTSQSTSQSESKIKQRIEAKYGQPDIYGGQKEGQRNNKLKY